jgi:methylated-DNA-[protein]-cysteine S-methyltransferase
MPMRLFLDQLSTPIGTLQILSDGEALVAVEYEGYEARLKRLLQKRFQEFQLVPTPNPGGFTARFEAYFDGDLHALDSLPVSPGGTPFQQTVWEALRRIPVGQTWTYGQLAAAIGRPTASRAVGYANSLNPIAIVIPCHRVIGAKDELTGYAGGLERKQWLLAHEGALRQTVLREVHP